MAEASITCSRCGEKFSQAWFPVHVREHFEEGDR